MIFAAGFGTRMRPLTENLPKPMVPVLGRPMIDYAIKLARSAGATNIVSNLHYKPDSLRTHLEQQNIMTVLEHPDILDTGGGLRNALPLFAQDTIWSMNPDAIWQGPNPLTFAKNSWQPDKMDALLVCIEPNRALSTSSMGDFKINPEGQVTRGPGFVFGGVQILNTRRLVEIKEVSFSLNALWDQLIAEGRCYASVYTGKWCDIGTPEGIPVAENLLQQQPYV